MVSSRVYSLISLLILGLGGCISSADTKSAVNPSLNIPPAPSVTASSATPINNFPAAAIPTSTASLTDQSFITVSTGYGGDSINVRSGPGVSFPKVWLLKSGEKASALGQTAEKDWIWIKLPNIPQGSGWIYSQYVTLSDSDLPIIDRGTGKIVTPTPASISLVDEMAAVEIIKKYLKQGDLQSQYLGEEDNLNNISHPDQEMQKFLVGNTIYYIDLQTKKSSG